MQIKHSDMKTEFCLVVLQNKANVRAMGIVYIMYNYVIDIL